MRIVVFGTGGVGGFFGGRLARAGEDVTFIARGEHLSAIKANGLKVDSTADDFLIYPAKATDDVSEVGETELVILGVKAWQVPEAARAVKPIVGPSTTMLPLQNGVDAVPQLVDELGQNNVIGGSVGLSAMSLDQVIFDMPASRHQSSSARSITEERIASRGSRKSLSARGWR